MNTLQLSPNFKPMLAYNGSWTWDDIKWPVAVTPKLDGIRVLIINGKPWTRAMKRIPNKFLSDLLSYTMLDGLDGEITIPGCSFHEIQSYVMSETDNKHCNGISYNVFDDWKRKDIYVNRVEHTGESVGHINWINMLYPEICNTQDEVSQLYYKYGAEGLILRHPLGPYKQGRSTLREQYMIKFVEWRTDEAICVDVIELQRNSETSTTQKANMSGGNTLGSLLVDHPTFGQFNIGSGFTDRQRKEFWANPPLGEKVTFKFKPYGTKDLPRTPIFCGIRKD